MERVDDIAGLLVVLSHRLTLFFWILVVTKYFALICWRGSHELGQPLEGDLNHDYILAGCGKRVLRCGKRESHHYARPRINELRRSVTVIWQVERLFPCGLR